MPTKFTIGDAPKPQFKIGDAPSEDDRNAVQREFDKLTETKPLDFSSVPKAIDSTVGNFGGGVMSLASPFVHPIQTLKTVSDLAQVATNPGAAAFSPTVRGMIESESKHPDENTSGYLRRLGGQAFTLGGGLAGAEIGGDVLPNAFAKIPSASRAGATLQDIRNAASEVPVNLEKTSPELQRFEELTARGGRRSKPLTQLFKRTQDAENPVLFPEARDFYSNVGDAAHQTTLQRLMGRGMKPVMRRQAVNVRRAMNEDLTNAAGQIGRGEDYTNAMREYANAKKLQKVTRGAALLGAGEAARRTGLLGNWIHRTALQQ